MQIQRIQSLWLLLAAVCGALSLCFKWLDINGVFVTPLNDPMLGTLACLAILLPLLAIFMYRNLKRQKLVCRLGVLFALFAVGYAVALSYLGPNPEADIRIVGPILMACDCLACIMATRAIARDEKLLRDADRIR